MTKATPVGFVLLLGTVKFDNINAMMKLGVPIVIIVGSGGIADAIYGYREKSRSHFFGWKSLQNV